DIIRQRAKGAAGVESLEWVGATDNVGTTSAVDTPEKALEKAEKATVIEEAIASLPERLRDTFILHFYQQRSHTEIAEMQSITYDNVCKRISLARKQLKEKLSSYFHGIDGDNQQQEPGEKAIAQKDSTYHVGIITQKKDFDPSPRPHVSASVLTTGHPPDKISTVDQKETGVIAPLEDSAVSKSKGAIVNSNSSEMTDEENQQKREHLVVAIASFEVTDVETREAGAIAFLTEGLQDKFSLHFYNQHSQTEIAQGNEITYDNVCKRISFAPKQIKKKFSSYFLLSHVSRLTKIVWGLLLLQYDLTLLVCACSSG
ncbi:MAG: sigma-70 family RNA polymerase sigma factor, partial [Symploca sp. SIO2D2]|nr:sigma-70 family RNA polymerase sigma factor [Symploca sp. SIO2D2]